jgi:hypothetical protein
LFFLARFCACESVNAEEEDEVEASASAEGVLRICVRAVRGLS